MKVKDLINIGIFSTIYFVITTVIAMLGFIPIFLPLLAVLVPLLGGVPFMLFLTKVKTFGMIWIMSVIMGIMMPAWMCPVLFAAAFVCGIIGALAGKKLLKKHFRKAGMA